MLSTFAFLVVFFASHEYFQYEKSKTPEGAEELALQYFLRSMENTSQLKLMDLSSQAKCQIFLPSMEGDSFRYVADCTTPTDCASQIRMPVYIMKDGTVGNPSGSVSQALLRGCPGMIDDANKLTLPDNWQQGG